MNFTKQDALASLYLCQMIGGDTKEKPVGIISSRCTSAAGMVTVDHDLKTVTATFCGSKEPKDFVYDAKSRKVTIGYLSDEPVRVHEGFNEQSLSIHDAMQVVFLKTCNLYPQYTGVISGHSLGKSVGELFALRLRELPDQIRIVTFGGALTGNRQFCDYLRVRVPHNFCFYNEQDIVPKLLRGKFSYEASGMQIELKESKHQGHPVNVAAALFNHDTHRDYWQPISELPGKLNEGIN